jgi:hypothetical protein
MLEQRRQDQDMAQVHRFSKKVGNIGTEQLFVKAAIREGLSRDNPVTSKILKYQRQDWMLEKIFSP